MDDDTTGMRDTVAASTPHDTRSTFEFTRGSLINRYVVLERLGAGGMSIVYAAYDPELRRRVALKLLLVDADADQARLLREARAIARLSHPNVVTVFDVGTFEGRVYVTMEYIDGQTLRQWWSSAVRPWTEILAVFHDAARGLSAAHAASLVHRDFKPENVLIGKDGRVRVLDFGLARRAVGDLETSVAKSFESVVVPGTDVFRLEISRAGALVGTPAYMAPEQLADSTIDHRADQFAFCVALFEGLFGRRPFKGDTIIELLTAVAQGNLEFGDTRKIPKAITRVLRRGLAAHAAQRYASMDELSRALARASTVRTAARRVWLAAAGLTAAAAIYGWLAVDVPEAHAARCDDAALRLADVWNGQRAAAIDASLTATDRRYARDTIPLVRAQLAHYADRWSSAHQLVCDATYVHNTQAAPLLHARLACLDEYLADLRTAVDILAESDAAVAARAIQAASELPAPDRCTTAAGRENEAHLPPETAAAVQAVREALSRIRVEGDAGRQDRARALASGAVAQADAAGYAPIEAEALLHLGFTEIAAADLESAETHLNAAYDLAEESGFDHVRAAAATRLVHLVGELRSRDSEALMWARVARAAIRRLGSPTQLQVELHANLAGVHLRFARYADALTDLRRAIELDSGATSYRIAAYHARLGAVHIRRRRHQEALEEFEQSIRLGTTSLGPQHPWLASPVYFRGWTRLNLGATADAERDFREAVGIIEAASGPDDAALGQPLNGLGSVALIRGDFAAAAETYRRVLDLVGRQLGPDAPGLLGATTNLTETLHRAGDAAGSIRTGEQALAICERSFGADNERCADVMTHLARAHVRAGHLDVAAPLVDRAVVILEGTQGPTFPELTRPLVAQGLIALARDRPVDALPPLERALVLARNAWELPLEHAELRLALADALWRADRDRLRARQLALEVQSRLRGEQDSVGQRGALARADAWLTAHPSA